MSDDYEIKPEWREAYTIAKEFPRPSQLANLCELIIYLLAKLRESEFHREHEEYQATSVDAANVLPWYCSDCGQKSNWDERHDYDDAAWLEVARKELERRADEQDKL